MEIALQIVYTKINFLAWVYHGCRWCIRFMPSDTCSKKYIDRSLGEWFVSKGELDHVFLKFVSKFLRHLGGNEFPFCNIDECCICTYPPVVVELP